MRWEKKSEAHRREGRGEKQQRRARREHKEGGRGGGHKTFPSQASPPSRVRTWVMEDKVGDIVGENCLGCCRLVSPAMGRVRGLRGTLRRGEAFRGV